MATRIPVGCSSAASKKSGVAVFSRRSSPTANSAMTKAAMPEPSVTVILASEFIASHCISMKTPKPASTKIPPK